MDRPILRGWDTANLTGVQRLAQTCAAAARPRSCAAAARSRKELCGTSSAERFSRGAHFRSDAPHNRTIIGFCTSHHSFSSFLSTLRELLVQLSSSVRMVDLTP